MSWRLERHLYAPELNKVHLTRKDGSHHTFDAPGIRSLADFREKYRKPLKPTICATLKCTYHSPEQSWLNSNLAGTVVHRRDVLRVLKNMQNYHNAGPRDIKVRTFLIG
jgi:hypothetical protein